MRSASTQPRDLTLEVERPAPGAVVITVRGELDISGAPALREVLERSVAERPESLVLDLTGVSFMDSIALAVVVQASRSLGHANQLLIVVGTDSYARLILEATGLTHCLNVVMTDGAAHEAAS
jgi:anti-anti-sigma factor